MNPALNGLRRGQRRYSSSRIRTNLNSRPVKRTVDFHGVEVSVEYDIGDTKRGIGDYGEVWTQTYEVPYGEIPNSRTLADGEGVDIYLGPKGEKAKMVFVVHQLKRDGTFDEDKVMAGFNDEASAVDAYKRHGPAGRFGGVDVLTVPEFLNGYLASNRKL